MDWIDKWIALQKQLWIWIVDCTPKMPECQMPCLYDSNLSVGALKSCITKYLATMQVISNEAGASRA